MGSPSFGILLLRFLYRHLRDPSTGSMSSPMGTASRFRVVVGLTSALLCHTRFPTVTVLLKTLLGVVHTVGFFTLHFSVQVEMVSIILEINWNELVLSILVQPFLKMNPDQF